MTPTPNAKHQPSTHSQPYDQLLVGLIMGAVQLECHAPRDEEDDTAPQHPAPTPMPMSQLLTGWIWGAEGPK